MSINKPLICKILSRVFLYPDEDLKNHMQALAHILHTVSPDTRIDAFDSKPLLEWQTLYTETFDVNKMHSLHLYEHIYGQSRNRGNAMLSLRNYYEKHGFYLVSNELPDYLPIILEFLSQQTTERIDELTPAIISVVALLDRRLKNNEYSVFMSVLHTLCVGKTDQLFVEVSLKKKPLQKLDDLWEEPIAFENDISMRENV